MKKINKITNIALIFMMILVFLSPDYAYSANVAYLRVPIALTNTYERLTEAQIKSRITQWNQLEKAISEFLVSENLTLLNFSDKETMERLQDYMEEHGYGRMEYGSISRDLQYTTESAREIAKQLINSDRLGRTVVGSISIPLLFKIQQYTGKVASTFFINLALEEIQYLLRRYGGVAYVDHDKGVIRFVFRSGLSEANNQRLLGLIYRILLNRFKESYTCAVVQVKKIDTTVSIDSIQHAIANAVSDYTGTIERLPEGGWRIILNGRGRSIKNLNKRLKEILSVARDQLRKDNFDIELDGEFILFEDSVFMPIDAVYVYASELKTILQEDTIQPIDIGTVFNMVEEVAAGKVIDSLKVLMNGEPLSVDVARDPSYREPQGADLQYRPGIRFGNDLMPCHSSIVRLVKTGEEAKDMFANLPGGYMVLQHKDSLYILPSFYELYRELPRFARADDGSIIKDTRYQNFVASALNYSSLLTFAGIDSKDAVLEIFSGTGALSFFAALYAKKVFGLDIAIGKDYLPDLNRQVLNDALSLFPEVARPSMAETTFFKLDATDPEGVLKKLGFRKFPIIVGDPPIGWGFKLPNEEKGFQIFLRTIPTIKALLETDGAAVFRVTRNWLRRKELAKALKRNKLKITAIHPDLDSRTLAIISIVSDEEERDSKEGQEHFLDEDLRRSSIDI